MDIVNDLKNITLSVSQLRSSLIDVWKAIKQLQGTEKDKKSIIVSGSYYARITPVYHERYSAVQMRIEISDSRVEFEQVVELDSYAAMFKRNRKDLELFLLINNVDPLNFNEIKNIKFEVKIGKGVADNQAALIKSIHAVGLWKNSFIEIDGDKIHG